ncbi:MAG: Gfo/Idh/MocA family oxidoreductase [Hyphomicrobiaceae bacterium]
MTHSTTSPVRIGIIGFGIMGERLLRAALAKSGDVMTVSGAWDPSPAAMSRLGSELPDVTRHASVAALIAASDVVHVASPPTSHLAYLDQAAGAGIAVLSEKPLAVDVAAARAAVATHEAAGTRAGVNFVLASSLAVDQINAWRAEGLVGAPERLTIDVDFAQWPRPWQMDAASWLGKCAEGGFTREVVSHFLFLTLRTFGSLDLVSRTATFPPGDGSETAVSAELRAGGLPVSLTGRVGGTAKPDHNLWTLTGDKGSIRLRDWSFAERLMPDGAWCEAEGAIPNEKARPLVLARQLDKVIAMTRGTGPGVAAGLATLREALIVQETVEAILGL